MQTQKGISTLATVLIIVAVVIVIGGGVLAYQYFSAKTQPVVQKQQNQNQQQQTVNQQTNVVPPINQTAGSVVITLVSGPTHLDVGQTGTWIINATMPAGAPKTYSVIWDHATTSLAEVQHTSVFSHSYSAPGTYSLVFSAEASYNSCQGNPGKEGCPNPFAQTNLTVNVQPINQTAQPSITITSPNGGETWQAVNDVNTIKWTYSGIENGANVSIVIVDQNNKGVCDTSEGFTPLGDKQLTVSHDYLYVSGCAGNNRRVKIIFQGNKTTTPNYDVTGYSGYFSIVK